MKNSTEMPLMMFEFNGPITQSLVSSQSKTALLLSSQFMFLEWTEGVLLKFHTYQLSLFQMYSLQHMYGVGYTTFYFNYWLIEDANNFNDEFPFGKYFILKSCY